jgi:hypothetical protein
VIRTSLFLVKKVLTVVFSFVFGYLCIRLMIRAHARTGHRILLFEVLCWVMHASFSPFFWFSNVMETHSADSNWVSDSECGMVIM